MPMLHAQTAVDPSVVRWLWFLLGTFVGACAVLLWAVLSMARDEVEHFAASHGAAGCGDGQRR